MASKRTPTFQSIVLLHTTSSLWLPMDHLYLSMASGHLAKYTTEVTKKLFLKIDGNGDRLDCRIDACSATALELQL